MPLCVLAKELAFVRGACQTLIGRSAALIFALSNPQRSEYDQKMSEQEGPTERQDTTPAKPSELSAEGKKQAAPPQLNSESANLDDGEVVKARRRVDRLLGEYSQSHQNIFNKIIHWLAVPAIAWCALALLWSLPYPAQLQYVPGLNWAWIVAGLSIIYYLTLSIPLALGMAGFIAVSFFIIGVYLNWGDLPLWQLAIALFVVAWIFQFIGHKIEGRQPSFFKDLQFLLIGPAWLLAALFRLFKVRY